MDVSFVKLENRGLIHVEGKDRHDFLQGLITNDMGKLAPGRALYACLLTPQGKFLHDFFISEGEDFILLECEGGDRARDLYERLNKYRLRADVQISVEEAVPVYVILPTSSFRRKPESSRDEEQDPGFRRDDNGAGYPDPRDPEMGYRSFEKPDGLEDRPFEDWDKHRISLGIPDGSRDLIPEKSTMDEGRIDQFNGVDYEKGCYVGQELTARMHYRGLGKKHLASVTFKPSLRANESERNNPENWIATSASPPRNDIKIIELRSSCGDIGLALVKNSTPENKNY